MQLEVMRYKPRIGHITVMFGLFLSLLTLTFSSVNAPKTIAFGTSEIASMSNQYRQQSGLADLQINSTLTSSAQAKADDMASKLYFAHDAPDGRTPWDFFNAAGYSYLSAGENLALSNQAATSVVDGWYNSPGHRANLLNASYSEVGYGISFVPHFTYNGVDYTNVYLVAAHYGQPQQQAVAPAATSAPAAPQAPEVEAVTQQTEPTSSTASAPETLPSGTIAVATPTQPQLPSQMAVIGLGLGLIIIITGVIIELRRLAHHLPLVPGLHT